MKYVRAARHERSLICGPMVFDYMERHLEP
jgi:hypothetical protein